ncbi:amino acid transporter [Ignicoccus pacificus DSM 13166]|uniref:Amino acid transporter n=1 Tax=Ignicoccus pacificus DSM 13166 TaxID=940294 RepID=A0A977KAP2_9CREN|nr:amino acid transporter [Ignicoccus pacificus DSM 13166]
MSEVHKGTHKLGLKELVAIGVGGMIGGGIFSVLGLLIQYAGPAAPFAFSIGAITAFLTAYSYAKFSYYHPCMGGTIEYIAMGIKNLFVLDYINSLLWVGYVVMVSLYAYAFGSYGAAMLGFAEGTFWYAIVRHALTTIVLIVFMVINLLGSHIMGKVEDVLVYIKVAILVMFALIGMTRSNPQMLFTEKWPPWYMILLGGMIIFSAYEGFGIISNAGLDAKSKRDIYWAFFLSVAIVAAIYISIAYVSVTTLKPQQIVKYEDYALGIIAEPILGKLGFTIIGIAALLSTASAINATIFGAARIAHFIPKTNKIVGKEALEVELLKYEITISTLISMILANFYNLSNISLMGSMGFLLVYLAVNYSAYKLADKIKAKRPIIVLAIFFTLFPALILASTSLYVAFWSQLKALSTLLLPPLIITIALRPARKIIWRKYYMQLFEEFYSK